MRTTGLLLLLFVCACSSREERACDQYVADVEICYDDFCDGAGVDSPFCGCWNAGEDIDIGTCECIPLSDLTAVCDVVDVESMVFDCGAAEAAVGSFCT